MIEFTLNRHKKGKKSRWVKKYPRKRILKRSSEKAAGWYFHNWYDDDYHYFGEDLNKFLLANVGRPVDKVFSEFLKRCRRGTEKFSLRDKFYDMFKEKENIDYYGGFYLSNGIINYKKRRKRPQRNYTSSTFDCDQFNIQNLPSRRTLFTLCKEAEKTHKKQFLGKFYISDSYCGKVRKATVYVATRLDYEASYFYMSLAEIKTIGIGVRFSVWGGPDGKDVIDPYYTSYYSYKWSTPRVLPQYVFIVKKEKNP